MRDLPIQRVMVLSAVAALLASACSTASTATTTAATTTVAVDPTLPFGEELQSALDGVLEVEDPMGFTLAVMVPGYQPWVGVAGVSEPGVPITADMAFGIGSATKSFIAALVLQLAEEGKLSLDDRLNQWLPDYPNVDNTATIRQLLNHTSGTFQPNHHPDFWPTIFADGGRVWTDEEIYSTFLLEPYAAKGSEWNYSNANYMMLGTIIEEATGSTVSAELRERFFEPLGLTSAFYLSEETPSGAVAEGWFDVSPYAPEVDSDPALEPFSQFPWPATMAEAGGLFATSQDLATWAQALWGDRRVLSATSMEEMLDFVAPEPDDERGILMAGYGLGAVRFNPELFDGTPLVIGHSGGALFYSAAAMYLPDYGVTIGAALNSDHDVFGSVLTEVISLITTNVEPLS